MEGRSQEVLEVATLGRGGLPEQVMLQQRLEGGTGGRYVTSGEQREMGRALSICVPGV